jgi:transposase
LWPFASPSCALPALCRQSFQSRKRPRRGALAHGFDSGLWTLRRIAVVIERVTGVRHHPSYVCGSLVSWAGPLQRPQRRATERDEEQIARWVK